MHFAFALTGRKSMRTIYPGCRSYVALPWAGSWLALQAALVKMWAKIS